MINELIPTRADIEAYHCTCALDSGILTTDTGAQIDLGKILDTYGLMFEALTDVTKLMVMQSPYHFRPEVQTALKAIATATGKSTFGNDWMDALDQPGSTS